MTRVSKRRPKGISGITPAKVERILGSGRFKEFIGVKENDVFEAKTPRPYELDSSDNVKTIEAIAELVSDIASIANKVGGYIVCGLNITPIHTARTDEVVSLDLFPKEDFYLEDQINGILNNKDSKAIYPRLEVEVSWYPSKNDPSKGLGVIKIPKQEEDKKRFIVQITQTDGHIHKNFVGIPVRQGHDTVWFSAERIHHLSKKRPERWQESHQMLLENIRAVSEQVQQLASEVQKITVVRGKREDLLMRKIKEATGDE